MTRLRAVVMAIGVVGGVSALIGCGTGRLPKPDSRVVAGTPFTVVDLRPTAGRLKDQLAKAAAQASASHLRPYVELTSAWSPACHWLDHSLSMTSLAQAFGGTYVVRVDTDRWEGQLAGTGLDYHTGPLPAFVAINERGRPFGDWVDRTDWNSDLPTAVAPVLADFFHWPGV